MSDHDFDFRRPTQRREAKPFEPPPWEREAFDELQRKRAGQEVTQGSGEQPEVGSAVAGTEQPMPVEPAAAEVDSEAAAATQATAAADEGPLVAGRGEVDEGLVVELMAGLAAEEPSMQPTVERVSLVSALVIAAIGTVMILWGMAALIGSRVSGPIGAFGGSILLFFGAVAIAGAVWLTVRTLRQRGVL